MIVKRFKYTVTSFAYLFNFGEYTQNTRIYGLSALTK